jgi:hypothetical protein
MFINSTKKKFLFKCQDCQMILSIELEEEDDIQKVEDNEMVLECPCGDNCYVLRD